MTLLTFGETPLRFTPAGHERLAAAGETEVYADGAASNAAVAATVTDETATWVSKLPDGPLGRRVVAELRRHGVETEVTWADAGRQGLVFDERGATPREAETVHDRGRTAVSTATPGDLPMGLFQTADAVFVDTNTATRSDQAAETSRAILRAAHGAGVLTATDLDHRPGLAPAAAVESVFESMTESLDCLVASEDQIRRVLGESGKPREQATAVAAAYDLEMVVVTLSERGAVVLQDTPGTNVLHERGGLDGEVVDPAGAHAAFTGAFLERLTGGADAADALSYGVAAATLVRSLPGPTLQATPAELATVADSVGERSR